METSTLCGLWGWRPAWIQRFARKEVRLEWDKLKTNNIIERIRFQITVPVAGSISIHDKMQWFLCPDLHPAVLCAGGGAGHGPHLPVLSALHHWEAVRDQIPGGGLDLLRQRDKSDRLHLCYPLPGKVELWVVKQLFKPNLVKATEKNTVDINCVNCVRFWHFSLCDALSGKESDLKWKFPNIDRYFLGSRQVPVRGRLGDSHSVI